MLHLPARQACMDSREASLWATSSPSPSPSLASSMASPPVTASPLQATPKPLQATPRLSQSDPPACLMALPSAVMGCPPLDRPPLQAYPLTGLSGSAAILTTLDQVSSRYKCPAPFMLQRIVSSSISIGLILVAVDIGSVPDCRSHAPDWLAPITSLTTV